ncbi:HAD family hydrolase [Blastococcus sp. TF02-09]|uniref:HAD family hydrolase n=1 Tax=Blastococcus sp. TF02-09 TaxID=2250576 RepID=UPI000DE82888|nr:HAD family hydrolase [Blastococcus sp. TF02-9]RBY81275.1 HAD family hydrolase [Blastococcus sp. TF02-9]
MPLALFDLDNTLADRERAFRLFAAQLLEQHGLPPEHLPWLIQADGDGFVPRPQFLEAARQHLGLAVMLDELIRWYDATYPTCYVREPDSIKALRTLKQAGWLLAVVTNGRTSIQSEKVRRTGLDAVVDVVCISEDVGVRKPDPAIFYEAARRCGAPLTGWMVGDSASADVGGGAGVGLRTAWLHRQRTWDPAAEPPDLVVDRVADVAAHLLDSSA